jgi:hypothetical protein
MNNVLSWTLKLIGAFLIFLGAQTWGFHNFVAPRIENADANLIALLEEAPTNSLIDATLTTLRDYRRANDDEVQSRQILGLRETIVRGYRNDPRAVIDEALRISVGLNGDTDIEQELLATLRRNLLRLQAMYTDHYAEVIARYSRAPLYLQPTAALLSLNRSSRERFEFNHALYRMLSGDHGAANSMYSELRRSTQDDLINSRALYGQARLQFEAFRIDGDPEYYRQARQYTQESLSNDPAQGVPKLFLEYLLSIDQQAVDVESAPEEGQGSGESEGERGSLSSGAVEH